MLAATPLQAALRKDEPSDVLQPGEQLRCGCRLPDDVPAGPQCDFQKQHGCPKNTVPACGRASARQDG